MKREMDQTMQFSVGRENGQTVEDIILAVYHAMKEKGYDPINQIVGYIISGDPTYITSYQNARYLIRQVERDELLEELVQSYIRHHDKPAE